MCTWAVHQQVHTHTHTEDSEGDRCCWVFLLKQSIFRIIVHYFCSSGCSHSLGSACPTGRVFLEKNSVQEHKRQFHYYLTWLLRNTVTHCCYFQHVFKYKSCTTPLLFCHVFHASLSFLPQTSRPEAFPHPHRLPAEGNRLGTNRPCSQVSAPPLHGCCVAAHPEHALTIPSIAFDVPELFLRHVHLLPPHFTACAVKTTEECLPLLNKNLRIHTH